MYGNTMDGSFRCRKCGCFLFTPEHLVSNQKIENEERVGFTQWFLKHDVACPEWAEQAILKEQYTRGKLTCPKCLGRVGAFDFVGKREHFQLGPVWVQKCRVDLIRHVPIAPVPHQCKPRRLLKTSNDENTLATFEKYPHTKNVDLTTSSLLSGDSNGTISSSNSSSYNSIGVVNVHHEDDSTQPINADVIVTNKQKHSEPIPKVDVEEDSEVKTAFTCAICLDILFQAHTCRPCLHVYCAPCLRRLSGASPFNTKCPLCREIIAACIPNNEMSNIVLSVFPKEYGNREALEKKTRKSLPALPSNRTFPFTNFNRNRNQNHVYPQWAGICFVVLLVVVAVSVMATTVGMLLWYLWEMLMDYFIDGLVSINGYFDYSWQVLIMILMEKSDEISPELAKKLAGSFGQVLHAVGKLFNRTVVSSHQTQPNKDNDKTVNLESDAQMNYVISAFQVDLANYVLIMCVVTYLIYRFARYRQTRQIEAAQLM